VDFDDAAPLYVDALEGVRLRSRFGPRRHQLQTATVRIVGVGESPPQSVGAIEAARSARGRKLAC
jgi:hypothetical protein